jgi:hypothetical protein
MINLFLAMEFVWEPDDTVLYSARKSPINHLIHNYNDCFRNTHQQHQCAFDETQNLCTLIVVKPVDKGVD